MGMILKTVEEDRGAFEIALSADGTSATLDESNFDDDAGAHEGVVKFISHHEMARVGAALVTASARWRTLQGD
jgi:hypothetical protein